MSTPMFLAYQNEVRQERIEGRKSMVFAVEFSDSDHVCKQNQWRTLRFGSVKKGLVLSGSKGGVPWQFKAGKLWQIVLFSVKLQRYLSSMQVCGLKWSYDSRESYFCERTAAMKATTWSPHLHGLLASGGETADRCIRFWNTTTNSHLSCMDTGSEERQFWKLYKEDQPRCSIVMRTSGELVHLLAYLLEPLNYFCN